MAGVDRSLRYAGGFAPARRPTQTAVPVTFVNGRDGDICIWWTQKRLVGRADRNPQGSLTSPNRRKVLGCFVPRVLIQL